MTQFAIITGAAGGMGTAIASLLGRTQELLLTDVNREKLNELLEKLSDEGIQAQGLVGDLSDPHVAASLAERCAGSGNIRSIVNAAGLSPAQADWHSIIRANIIGPVQMLNVLEPLLGAGTACVMIASVAGHLGPPDTEIERLLDNPLQSDLYGLLEPKLTALVAAQGGTMEGHAYSFSKRAILRLCETRALDWGDKKARIVSLSPGVVATPMGQKEAESGNRAQALVDATPAGRWGTAADIAAAVEFLLSNEAGYITGSDIRVDGGAVAAMRGKAF
ncbi:SDR family oxidoreductase [Parasphingorhabdus sp.]|uniref:SDR family oxidoreductase n=1 Tax=Parasphingorhabdus sp. TaxID=2709688 RepID=UPI003BB17AC6